MAITLAPGVLSANPDFANRLRYTSFQPNDRPYFYLVASPSTPHEACDTRNQPEVAFLLTESGEVENVALTRGSGNPSVDQKVLQMVRDSRYPSTNCGVCAVFAEVSVSLKGR